MQYRSFNTHVEATAAECRKSPFTAEQFEVIGGRAGGGTGAVPVRMLNSGLPAWAKPDGNGADKLKHVAHERIAFCLGYDLGLPVSSVTMSRDTANKNLHQIVAISYPALPAGKPWDNSLPPDLVASLRPTFSAMYPFLAWLDDHDHFGGANTHYEIVAGEPRVAFFDFSYSQTEAWGVPGPPQNRPQWQQRTPPYHLLDTDIALEFMKRIEGFPVNELGRIIDETPPDCLLPDTRAHLLTALDQRRGQLRGVLNL